MPHTHDIAILGATAAGYVAALALAKHGRKVIVLDAPAARTESPLADWVPGDLLTDCPILKPLKARVFGAPFRNVRFHSPELDRDASYAARTPAGYLLPAGALTEALDALARQAGVERVSMKAWPKLTLGESSVTLIDRHPTEASLLMIAQDAPSEVVARLAIPVRSIPQSWMVAWGLDAPAPAGRRADADLHVVSFGKAERLGIFFQTGGVAHVRMISSTSSGRLGPDDLTSFAASLAEAGLLPVKTNFAKATAAMWRPPGGMALDLEMHLAKRTMLIGTAGGFASAMSGQTLDPGIRSAVVAAEIAHRALSAGKAQDVLSEFKTKWRDDLADRIRPPGSSLQMLMPMALSNKAMTARFAKALLYGESI